MFALNDGCIVLSATDIAAHLACAHLEQQRLAIAHGERAPPHAPNDPHGELVRRRGDRHEAEQLAALSAEAGGDVVDLTRELDVRDRRHLETAAAETESAMQSGARLIFQPTFFDGRWLGRADFLRRVAVTSKLGPFAYELLDTKLSRQLKPAFVHQLALYSRLVAAVQGIEPPVAHVILGDGTVAPIQLRCFAALHRHVVRAVEATSVSPAVATYPEPVAHCDICDYAAECRRRWVTVDHLSLVAGARRADRERLEDSGITSVVGLADAPPGLGAGSLGVDRFELLRHQAQLQVRSRETGEPCHRHLAPNRARGYARLPPPSPGDVFFDLEGDPFALPDRGIEYLWGWWTADRGYECAWGHDVAAERAALERFVDFVHARAASDPHMHVYHYAPHEVSTLRTLATLYATCEEEVDDLLRRGVLVDLFAVVRQGLQVGEESYSIKSLERHDGFIRKEHSVREGGGSIVAYETWLETADDGLLDAIRAYNEDDCRSTAALRDWLWIRMRPEAAARFNVDFSELAEPEPEEIPTPPAWLPEVQGLIDRIERQLPADPEDDSTDEAMRRLLAYLILYHRREGKPSWWRYFDLRGKTGEELVDERDAIALLTLDTSIGPVPVKRSLDWTLRFPAQEFRVDPGHAEDPTTGESYTVVSVEDDQIVLRRSNKKPAPEPAALIGGSPIGVAVLREALVEFAECVLGLDGRFAAARSLLRRDPPRLVSGTLGQETDELISATLGLDHSVLPVQGPPGTGKTFRGARMIVAALVAGRRVAISAPSHAAIQNLLECVEEHAHATGVSFSGIYKGSDYESTHGLVEYTDSNDAVSEEHQLVAGTAWLLARPENRESFDLVFVDEAGQYSLADATAVALAAKSIVLLGDPQQLPQVTQAAHPGGSGVSVLGHLLEGRATIPNDRGVLLTETWRMHPEVCAFVSERSYDNRLASRPNCANRRVAAPGALTGAGLRSVAVEHEGRSQASPEEAAAIAELCNSLLVGATVTEESGRSRPLIPSDILVVAPYNMAVRMIRGRVPSGVRVGTVDRFQGQQAPVVLFAMTCSSGEDVPRGLDFLFNPNRLNVAVSRAQCLAILIHNPRLLDANCLTVEQMALVDGVCRFVELAPEQTA